MALITGAERPHNQPTTGNTMKRLVIRRNANQIILKRGQLRVSFPTIELAKEALRIYWAGKPSHPSAELAIVDLRTIRSMMVSA
jgi:hypothetical protein